MNDLQQIDGLYVGQLSERELELFNRAIKEQRAYRSYEDVSGALGLAKVRLVRVPA